MGKYLVFRNYSSLLLNGYSIYGLCLTFWTNEFLGSYSNYKFIISFSIFSRMDLWRILCSLSNIEEVLSLSFYLPISPLWFSFSSSLLSPFPSLIEWVCGGYCVHCPTLKRFFLFHFIFPFLLCGFLFLHLFYLHFLSSNNPLRNSTNNKIPFFPFIF